MDKVKKKKNHHHQQQQQEQEQEQQQQQQQHFYRRNFFPSIEPSAAKRSLYQGVSSTSLCHDTETNFCPIMGGGTITLFQ
jgi:hypothetical protein